jgi:hypothetical protein
MSRTNPVTPSPRPTRLRPLQGNELVRRGDLIENGPAGYETWEGPGGFRACFFVKQIYRQLSRPSAARGKSP